MKKTAIYLTAALLFGAGSMVTAQETTTTETTDTGAATTEIQAAEQPAAPTDETYPVADENPEPQPGQLYAREKHGSWEVKCVKAQAAEDKDACTLYQLILDDSGSPVAEINLQRLPAGGKADAGVVFISPLETLLTKQVVMRVDSGKSSRYPFAWCDKFGCYSRFGLTAEQTSAMRKGATATITVFALSAPDHPLNLSVPLTGFTAAWKAVAP